MGPGTNCILNWLLGSGGVRLTGLGCKGSGLMAILVVIDEVEPFVQSSEPCGFELTVPARDLLQSEILGKRFRGHPCPLLWHRPATSVALAL